MATTGLAALPIGVAGACAYALSRPDWVARGAEWAAGWPEGSIRIGAIQWDRRLGVTDLELHPPKPRAPDVSIGHIEADWPDPWKLGDRVIDLGDVVVERVRVAARTQGPGDPPPGGGIELRASRVVVRDAAYTAPAQEPFQAVEVSGIEAAFRDVSWRPRARRIEGAGTASIALMDLGAIELEAMDAPSVTLADGDLRIGPTTFRYGRTEALAEGEIRGIDHQAAVELKVRLSGSRVETAVEDATGRASPLMGWLTSQVTVIAGGDLPPGGSRITGWVQLTDTHVFVGDSLKLIPKVLLDIAPWFEREDGGWLSVGNLRGEATFGRGWVELERLERASDKNRVLQAWGEVKGGAVDVTVRAVPKRDQDKAGVGVRLQGPIGKAKLQLAKRDHLLTAPSAIASR
ncbi:MAG: hypothetical protein H6738_09995 [Alphaproteobacteria bacterium]|nr:hypothetical protein [Alphaproteobacteria bacterium]